MSSGVQKINYWYEMGQPNEINSCTIGTLNSLRDLVLSGIKKIGI